MKKIWYSVEHTCAITAHLPSGLWHSALAENVDDDQKFVSDDDEAANRKHVGRILSLISVPTAALDSAVEHYPQRLLQCSSYSRR